MENEKMDKAIAEVKAFNEESKNNQLLKPCPFCGKEAELKQDPLFGSDNPEEFITISCTNNDCIMSNGIDALYDAISREQVIIDWNTRII